MFSIWAPQIAALLAAFVVSWGARKGFTLDQTVTTGIFVGVFTAVKTTISRYWNPGNVAAPELVDEPARQVRAIRRARGI